MCPVAKKTRKRNADATRADIIEAAKLVFTEKGFDQAGTRDIADKAGVNVALINRYYGSKEGLFREAVMPALTYSAADFTEDTDYPTLLTSLLMNKPEEIGFDPIITMLRSASSPVVGEMLQDSLNNAMIVPMSKAIGGTDGRERAAMAMSIIAGYDVLVRMMRLRPYDDPDRKALEARIHSVFTAALT